MKYIKEELLNKINGYDIDDDIKIELMEDITDSFTDGDDSALREEFENAKKEYEEKIVELKNRYKERFLAPIEDKKDVEEKIEDNEIEEKEIVDVKEI